MSINIANQVSFLRTSRNFPNEIEQLTVEMDKAYVDTANAVNQRTISLFPTMKSAVNGESWFLTGNQRQQGFRQVYTFTTTANIPHHVTNVVPGQFVRAFGEFTDGTNTYGLIYAGSVAIAGQITFYITSTNIVFVVGGGAPSVTSGTIVIEWLARP